MRSYYGRIYRRRRNRLRLRTKCRNCGSKVRGRFCCECGQKVTSGSERTLREIIASAADSLFSWDSKIFVTLKCLLFYPGRLTRDYFDGKIARYAHPAKLFWFLTLIFFALIFLPQLSTRRTVENAEHGIPLIIEINNDADPASGSSDEAGHQSGLPDEHGEADDTDADSATDHDAMVKGLLKSHLPYIVFLLIPLFALLLYIFFFRRQRYYAGHVIFALHFHSFVYVMAMTIIALSIFIHTKWLYWLYIVIPMLYFVAALRVAYGASYKRLWLIVPLIMFMYVVAMVILLIGYIILVMAIKEPSLLRD